MPVFKDYDQGQGIFRAIQPKDLLEPDHPARVIDKVVELLDLQEIYADYAGESIPGYNPQAMMKVLFFCAANSRLQASSCWCGLR
jgi:transposase